MTLSQWQTLGYDLHSMLSDPLDSVFVDWTASDYHLRTGSQAIDAGTDAVAAIVQYDLDGTVRPQGNGYDIGAYEFIEVGTEETGEVRLYQYTLFSTGMYVDFSDLHDGDRIRIYDLTGSCVHKTNDLASDHHRWYIQDIGSGVYFYIIKSTNREAVVRGRIVIIK